MLMHMVINSQTQLIELIELINDSQVDQIKPLFSASQSNQVAVVKLIDLVG